MNPIQSVLITGANAGLGREAARQLALRNGIEKIYLACRNLEKAEAAKTALEAETGKRIFEIIIMDVSDLSSVREAVAGMKSAVDAVILNAGGTGGRRPNALTNAGVTNIFAANILGHVVLVDELLERQLITSTVLYAGSEAARGIPKMGVAKPDMQSLSAEEFAAIADGSKFGQDADPLDVYSYIKLVGAHWMGAMARQHPHIRFVTMSPGGTTGTNGMDDLPFLKKVFFKYIGGTLMPIFGMMHSVETGARRYVDGLLNEKFESGHFYASREGSPTGPVIDQAEIDFTLANPDFQDNANQAVHRFAA
ncbi:SDR family NAD(P)-dependent oxidoreductase [Cognatiyoonia sp. IB215182]|uniref:SDR family NAD(P)-dependent oxidoreductase n=1 Tax=Cognatiyoonia sp. IB215182 TaxID=3097353 RepID=UPI002A17A4B2|nr:SDR family NAD(P)-dependent oxidoreductase [Cognatiyoonia sp. IB215182]MDX8355742.1 SDR family NAD(P)-dependent oxidoreductase [Cognatiyoonia sp. IB215182]